MSYERFHPARTLVEYRGAPGNEVGGLALSPMALDALADATVSRQPASLVVMGVYENPAGERYLDFGVPTDHIEAVSDFRWDREMKKLRLLCPECDLWDGKHTKSCKR